MNLKLNKPPFEEEVYSDLYNELQDQKEAAAHLNECLNDDDPNVFLMGMRDVIKANGGMKFLANGINNSRSTLYRTFSPGGNSGINKLKKILYFLGLEIEIKSLKK